MKPRRKGMTTARPVPDDFAANAWRRNDALAVRYGVSASVILKWRKATGLPGVKGRGPQKSRPGGLDTEAEIQACLTCTALDCSHGDCLRRKAAGL